MSSSTMTIRLADADKRRLEDLAKNTGRSRSFLAAEALTAFLDLNEWQVSGVHAAIRSLDAGEGISHRSVKDWVSSWGGDNELPSPK